MLNLLHGTRGRSAAWMVGGALLLAARWVAAAVPPSEQLLPDSTKAYLSVPSVSTLEEHFEATSLGRLLQDPVLKPFADDLRRQFEAQLTATRDQIGLTLNDFDGAVSAEVALGVVQAADGKPSVTILADVEGREAKAEELRVRLDGNLVESGAAKSQQTIEGVQLAIYDLPPKGERTETLRIIYFLDRGLLCITGHIEVAQGILQRLHGKKQPNLAGVERFRKVMDRVQADASGASPDVRWFVDPIGLAEVIRAYDPDVRRNPDLLKVLKNQGFMAVQGVGGHVFLATGSHELLHRTFVLAPPPYELAMRMLSFPSATEFTPQAWVPRDVVSYSSFHWDMQNAFDKFGTLFDEVVGEGETGLWDDVLESVKTDPNGPGIDIRADLVAHLGTRATLITDTRLPISGTSRRRLFAAETTNEALLAANVARSMKGDPSVRERSFQGYTIFEIQAQPDSELPTVELQAAEGAHEIGGGGATGAPNAAVAVAHGHLFVSSHVDLLEKILSEPEARTSLVNDPDYRLVTEQLQKLTGAETCAQSFLRLDDHFQVTYELFRGNNLPGADTPIALVLDAAIEEAPEGELRKPKVDGSKLPDYQIIRRYLGPTGLSVRNDPQGWYVIGFALRKDMPLAARP